MRQLNYSKIRRSTQADLRKYERIGVKMFTDALKLQAVPNPSPLPMQDAYVKFYQVVFVESAKKEYNRIRQDNREKNFVPDDFFLNTWREWIKDWVINNLGQLIFDVNANTDRQIKEIVAQGLEDGLNPFQIQALLTDLIPNQARARAIARTESTRGYNEGKKRSAQDWANQTGTSLYKIWVHGGAKEPRIQHIQAQDKPIPANGLFDFTNPDGTLVLMDKPGDYAGGPAQTVNCGCVIVYISESYARRNFPDWFGTGPSRPVVQPAITPSIEAQQQFIPTQAKYSDYNQFKNEYLRLIKGGKFIDDDEAINNRFETVQNTIAEIQGFRGLPKVLTNEEFINLSKNPEYTLVYRGISSSAIRNLDADDLINQYSKGELYGARANMYGNGTYWASESQYSVANTYAFGNDNHVFPALVKKSEMKLGDFSKLVNEWEREKQLYNDAVVKSYENKMGRTRLFDGTFAATNPTEFNEMINELKLFSEFGAWATSKGYDGYTVNVKTSPSSNFGFERTDYLVTLNRTKTIVSQSLRGRL